MSSSDSVSLSTSSSESIEFGRSRGRHVEEESTTSGGMVGGIPMETVREVREDPPEELAESNWPAKGGYGWVAADVHNQSSLFRLSRAGAGNRKVLLHVHVPLLSVTCVVAAGRLHHGCVAFIERCTHTTTSKQLGLYASLPRFVPIPISAAFSLCIYILL